MSPNLLTRRACALALAWIITSILARPQTSGSKKVFMIADMEGVDGIYNEDLQCVPFTSPRWAESQKLLTGEINAAVEGLFEGGATEVVVWGAHGDKGNLSLLDLDPRARLLTGGADPAAGLENVLDSSYGAVIFIGQHAMAGAEKGVLSYSFDYISPFLLPDFWVSNQDIWVNNQPTGEIGVRTMLAGTFGIPVVMLSGDTAACKEIHALVPEAECAEVKSGIDSERTPAALMLPRAEACALIREKAHRAMQRLPELRPYRLTGPVEVKVQLTEWGTRRFRPDKDVQRLNDRTWIFRGKDIIEAWLKFSSF